MKKKHTKRADKKSAKIKDVLEANSRLCKTISAIHSACALVTETEEALKLPRTAHDATLRDIAEHYNCISDALENKGIELCGGDLDEWIGLSNDYKSAL